MKCRYDLTKQCTVSCEKIRTCTWMANENRRKRLAAGTGEKADAPAGRKIYETNRKSGRKMADRNKRKDHRQILPK